MLKIQILILYRAVKDRWVKKTNEDIHVKGGKTEDQFNFIVESEDDKID